jgi:hypothetical protein
VAEDIEKTEVNTEVAEMVVDKAITRHVLAALGVPPKYRFTDVKHIMAGTVRVNVFVEEGDLFKTSKIAASFYLKVNAEGDIIGGDPIQHKYR